jgi:uncharacterized Ntn-hydrolase superfamily protein
MNFLNNKIIMTLLCVYSLGIGQQLSPLRPVATYSIVAMDEATGELGVAVQSHWFSVGFLVPWAKAGVGAVATQSFVKVDYGPDGLRLMESGMTATEALQTLISQDEGEAVRQVGMIDFNGDVTAHTGARCIEHAGHITGKGYSVQANIMAKGTVPKAMANAFENSKGDLADRMMAALEAAEAEGGDIRGKQSAAMLIVTGDPTGVDWKDTKLSLRIEDHPSPLVELKRLIRIHRAYQHANMGDHYMEIEEIENALLEYTKAEEYYPENEELPYWSAIALVNGGRLEDALPMFKNVFKRNPDLKEMTPRLIHSGLIVDDKEILKKIMAQ